MFSSFSFKIFYLNKYKNIKKAQQSLNDAFGLNIKYLLSIAAAKNLKKVNKRELCAQRNEILLKID